MKGVVSFGLGSCAGAEGVGDGMAAVLRLDLDRLGSRPKLGGKMQTVSSDEKTSFSESVIDPLRLVVRGLVEAVTSDSNDVLGVVGSDGGGVRVCVCG